MFLSHVFALVVFMANPDAVGKCNTLFPYIVKHCPYKQQFLHPGQYSVSIYQNGKKYLLAYSHKSFGDRFVYMNLEKNDETKELSVSCIEIEKNKKIMYLNDIFIYCCKDTVKYFPD